MYPSASGSLAITSLAPAPSAKSGPLRATSIGWTFPPIDIWPTALPSLTSKLIDTCPCVIDRFRRRRFPFSRLVVSTASPMGVEARSVTVQAAPSSTTDTVKPRSIACPPMAIFRA